METLKEIGKLIPFIEKHTMLTLIIIIAIILGLIFLILKNLSKILESIIKILDFIKDIFSNSKKNNKLNHNIPPFNINNFIGRKEQLKELNRKLNSNDSIVLVNGMGGIGKSTIALAYVHKPKFSKRYNRIEWITVNNTIKDTFFNHHFTTGITFNYDTNKKEDDNFMILQDTLREIEGKNLMVIDNANNEEDIINNLSELKRSNWKLLFTSRCKIKEIEENIEIDVLKPDEAKRLFLKHCKRNFDTEKLNELLAQIHYHTLLTELLAKTYDNQKSLTIEEFYTQIKKEDIKAKDLEVDIYPGQHADLTHAPKKDQIFHYFLSIFDLSALQDIDRKNLLYFSILPYIEMHFDDLKTFFNIEAEKENDFINSLNRLVANGWLQEKDNYYKMHPLIQTVIREKLKPNADNCREIIITFCSLLNYSPQESPFSRKGLIPFTENILKYINDEVEVLGRLHNILALIFRSLGFYGKSLEYNLKANKIAIQVFGEDHPNLATSYGNIALIYSSLGNYAKALEYENKDIAICEKVLEADHPHLATSYGNIALTYQDLGDYKKALEYQNKSIAILEKVLEPDHPDLATSYNNIASTYRSLGNYAKALEYQNKSIAILEKVLEPDHPDLATSYSNIALTYRSLGNYAKALEYQNKSIAILEKVLEANHPSLATSYNNIAGTYFDMTDYKRAKYFIEKAVEIYRTALPENHPYIKASLEWQNKINEALNKK